MSLMDGSKNFIKLICDYRKTINFLDENHRKVEEQLRFILNEYARKEKYSSASDKYVNEQIIIKPQIHQKIPNEHNDAVWVDRKSIHAQIVYNLLALKERKAVNVNAH